MFEIIFLISGKVQVFVYHFLPFPFHFVVQRNGKISIIIIFIILLILEFVKEALADGFPRES